MKTNKQRKIEKRDGREVPKRYLRKRKRYSDKFNIIFNFFLKSYRCDILTFCGVEVTVNHDSNAEEGKFIFRSYENGDFKIQNPVTRHPNIVKAVIVGKKSWGLFLQEWRGRHRGLFRWASRQCIRRYSSI